MGESPDMSKLNTNPDNIQPHQPPRRWFMPGQGGKPGAPGCCLWCGAKLRAKYRRDDDRPWQEKHRSVKRELTVEQTKRWQERESLPNNYYIDPDQPVKTGRHGRPIATVHVATRVPGVLVGYGNYHDNYFCGQTCGHRFAVAAAIVGYRVK